jgi:hypothetical protein
MRVFKLKIVSTTHWNNSYPISGARARRPPPTRRRRFFAATATVRLLCALPRPVPPTCPPPDWKYFEQRITRCFIFPASLPYVCKQNIFNQHLHSGCSCFHADTAEPSEYLVCKPNAFLSSTRCANLSTNVIAVTYVTQHSACMTSFANTYEHICGACACIYIYIHTYTQNNTYLYKVIDGQGSCAASHSEPLDVVFCPLGCRYRVLWYVPRLLSTAQRSSPQCNTCTHGCVLSTKVHCIWTT